MKKIFFSIIMFAAMNAHCQQKAFKVEVYGKGQPIILIPGFACSGDVWKETVDALKGNYQLHVLTLAGFAGVPPIDTPILKTVRNEIIQYVKENHLNKPVLIGHSLGAFMCLWVASEEPSLFSKILCVDGVPFLPAMTIPNITEEQAKSYFYHGQKSIIDKLNKTPDKPSEKLRLDSSLNLVNDSTHARLIAKWRKASDRKTLVYTYVEMNTTDLRREISKINIPVLILRSSDDTLGFTYDIEETPQKMFNEQFSQLHNKTIIIAPTKHFIMYDDPIWFVEEVKNFLRNGLAN
jgi:pimeloyl-ACP methyl ester carboxylesterase